MTKVFAFQIYHRGRLVAEAPLVVHDLAAAIEAAEQCILGDPRARLETAGALGLLIALRDGSGTSYTDLELDYMPPAGQVASPDVPPGGPADPAPAPRGREFI